MLKDMLTIAGGIIIAVVLIYLFWLKPDDTDYPG